MTVSTMINTSQSPGHRAAIHAIRCLYPLLVLLYYGVATTSSTCALHSVSSKFRDEKARRKLIVILELLFLSTYVAEIVSFISRAIVDYHWSCSQNQMVYLFFSTLVWSMEVFDLIDSSFPTWYPHYGSWAIGAVAETALLAIYAVFHLPDDPFTWAAGAVRICRITLVLSLPVVLFILRKSQLETIGDEESQSLLDREDSNPGPNDADVEQARTATIPSPGTYGALPRAQAFLAHSARKYFNRDPDPSLLDQLREIVKRHKSWWQYAKCFLVLIPYIWPFQSRILQLKLFLVILLSLVVCALEVLVPRQLGLIVDAFVTNSGSLPWIRLVIFLVLQLSILRFGIPYIQRLFWNAYDRYLLHALAMTAFVNLTQQSIVFSDRRRLAEIPLAVEYSQAIRDLLRTIISATMPRLAGMVASFVYFYFLFGTSLVMIAVLALFVLLVGTAKLEHWKCQSWSSLSDAKQEHLRKARGFLGIWHASLGSRHKASERKEYEEVVDKHVQSLGKYQRIHQAAGAFRLFILPLALLGAILLGCFQIAKGYKPLGNLVAMVAYWPQFSACVTLLAGFCGLDVDHLLQAENYLAMLERIPSAREAQRSSSPPSDDRSRGSTFSDESASPSSHQSAIDTVDHDTGNGSVHVSSTPSTDVPGLDNFSVEIEAGNTIAIVGKEGSIYSTVFSLLVGPVAILAKCISIGGVNLQNMGTYQVQDEIGTISQDPTLLNDTVLESVRDARPNATHLDVYLACDAACISYLEMLFAGQYDASTPGSNRDGTPVSRYLVSVAQAFLRDSKIIVLEPLKECKDIAAQTYVIEVLERLMKNRLTFVNGQDKETLIEVDSILYFENGNLAEVGNHTQLMPLKGKYFDFFNNHCAATSVQDDGSHNKQASSVLKQLCSIGLEALGNHLKGPKSHQGDTIYSAGENSKSIQRLLDGSVKHIPGKAGEFFHKGENVKSTSERNSTSSTNEAFPSLPAGRNKSNLSLGKGFIESASRSNVWKPDVPEFIPTSQRPAEVDHQGESSTSLPSQQPQLDPGSAATKPHREKETWAEGRERDKVEKELKKRQDAEKKIGSKMLKKAKKDDKAISKRKRKGRSHLAPTESGSSAPFASMESHSMASMDGTVDRPKPFFEKRKRTRSRHLKPKANISLASDSIDGRQRIPNQPKVGPVGCFVLAKKATPKEEVQDQKAVYRTPVYRRRAQSKSDPVGGGQYNGSDDQSCTAEASPSVKSGPKDYRRVSTPSDSLTRRPIIHGSSPSQGREHRQRLSKGQASGSGFSDHGSRSSPVDSSVPPQAQGVTFVVGLTNTGSGSREVRFEDHL